MVDVPPPPENPFMNEQGDAAYSEGETLDAGAPDVAASPGRVFAVLGIVGALLLLMLYLIFSPEKKEVKDTKKEDRTVAAAEPLQPPPLPQTPSLPSGSNAPPLLPPSLALPPSIPEPTQLTLIEPQDDGTEKKLALERMKSKMLLTDNVGEGGGLGNVLGGSTTPAPTAPTSADPNAAFQANAIAASQAVKAEATRIPNLNRTIAQGRIIHATLESALNTDLPAPIRAIVSRDTYGEAGREPLIPKGSRLIGTYNTDISGAQSRVMVVWTRVILPDGLDIAIGSPLVDQIGQGGIGGQVDTKFQSIFSRSILSSLVGIALAVGSDEISGGSTTTATSAVGGSTTTGDAATTATVDALNRLGATSDSFIQRFIDMRPTILVDQGTPVNVFVNRDLIFPADIGHSTRIIN